MPRRGDVLVGDCVFRRATARCWMLEVGSWSPAVLTRLSRRRTATTNPACEVRFGATLSRDRRTAVNEQRLPRDQVRAFDKTHHELRHVLRLAHVLEWRRPALTGARC